MIYKKRVQGGADAQVRIKVKGKRIKDSACGALSGWKAMKLGGLKADISSQLIEAGRAK